MNKLKKILFANIIITFSILLQTNLYSKNLFPVLKNEYVAYIDTTGNVVIDDEFETEYQIQTITTYNKNFIAIHFPDYAYFSEGKATFRKTWGFWFIRLGSEYGVIDTTGKVIIKKQDNLINNFKNGLALTKIPLKNFGFTYGKEFSYIDPNNNFPFVDKINKDENIDEIPTSLLISRNDSIFVIRTFDYASDFYNGWAMVFTHKKYNYINTNGELLSNKGFDDVHPFSEGKAVVLVDSVWCVVDANSKYLYPKNFYPDGKPIPNPRIKYLWNFHNDYARYTDDKVYGFLRADNKILMCDLYAGANDFSEGFAGVKLINNEFNFIDTLGKMISESNFDGVGNFKCGLAPVLKNGSWGYINPLGKIKINYQFDYATDFQDGFAYVWKNDLLMIINTDGKIIWKYNLSDLIKQ